MKITAFALAAVVAFPIHAQQSPQVSESIEVRVTNVDVVVTDRAGNPVHGLTASDFEIIEAGKPRPVTNFYEVRGTPAAQPAVTTQPAEAPAPAPEPPTAAARRRIVVFIDNTSVHPHSRKDMLATFEKSLDNLMRDGDQAMLVFFDGAGAQVLTPLTNDRAVLVAKLRDAASRSGGSFANDAQKNNILENANALLDSAEKDVEKQAEIAGGSNPGREREGAGFRGGEGFDSRPNKPTVQQAYSMAMSSANAFVDQAWRRQQALIRQLSGTIDSISIADGKKVLVLISGELAENPGAEILNRIDAMYAPFHRGATPAGNRNAARSLRGDLEKLTQQANAAGVTMYLVDASDNRGIDASAGNIERAQPEMMTANDTAFAMNQIALATGGIMVPGGKQFQTALDTIVRDLSSYYSLGYRGEAKGTARIQVRVKNRPELRVRTRQTFTEPARVAEAPAAPTPAAAAVPPAPAAAGNVPEMTDDLVRNRLLASVHDNDVRGDFPISVTASTPQPQGNGRAQTDLTITFPSTMTLIEEDGALKGRVAVYLVTSNADGRTSKVSTDVKELKFPLGTRSQIEAQKTFTFTVPLLVGKGPINVSVAVADQLAGTSGFAKTVVVTQ